MTPVETYKEITIVNVEMDHEIFDEAITITKEGMALAMDADVLSKSRSTVLWKKYGGNWIVIIGEGYKLFIAHKTEQFYHFFLKNKSIAYWDTPVERAANLGLWYISNSTREIWCCILANINKYVFY